jgi:hypothetical protein
LGGWGWVDKTADGLAAAFLQHGFDMRRQEVWRRNDGVLILADGAGRRRRLMAEVNSVHPEQAPRYRTVSRRFEGCAVPQVCSVPIDEPEDAPSRAAPLGVPAVFRRRSGPAPGASGERMPALGGAASPRAPSTAADVHSSADLAVRIGKAEASLRTVVSSLDLLQNEISVWHRFVQDLRCERL